MIVLWGLWNVRNKIGDREKVSRSSIEVFYKIFSFTQKWRILLKEGGARFLDDRLGRMKSWLTVFWKRTADMESEGVL
jgi:CRISPR/Cas system CMR-associated protein Cmr1 (group 7 of RAMP superfamily)